MRLVQQRIKMALGVACYVGYHAVQNAPVPASLIAGHYGMKPRSLEHIIQTLARANILKAVRGKDGGYYIEDTASLTLADVATAMIESPEKSIEKASQKAFDDILPHLKNSLKVAQIAWLEALKDVSIKQINDQMRKSGIKDPLKDFDFCI